MEEAKDKVYHVRLGKSEAATLEELTRAYGFRYTADLIRYAIEYIERTRPTLGRKFRAKKDDGALDEADLAEGKSE